MSESVGAKDSSNTTQSSEAWWKSGVVYQVWPASYKDSNGDGLGDIQGIISTLDYLKDLGVDMIWLSPMYKSPQHDMGYDISDYEDIYPPYGTLADMDELISEMSKRSMKLMLDLVINHTSDQHAWFHESRSSKTNAKASWYHWAPPKYINGQRHPPNNWRATFGGSAWDYVEERDEYYLHTFEPQQPDLNWESEECRKAIYDSAVRFWLDKKVQGFRMDVINFLSKNMDYPEAPITDPSSPYQRASQFYINGPRMHDYLRELRHDVLDPYGEIATVGECPSTSFSNSLDYVSASRKELGMIFDFDLVYTGGTLKKPWHETYRPPLRELKDALLKVQQFSAGTDAWSSVYGENHDFGRSVSRFGVDWYEDREYWKRSAKVLAMLFSSLTGTLFIYQGQEIGMGNMPANWGAEELQDIAALKYWKDMNEKHADDKELLKRAKDGLWRGGRDNVRTPVQWDDSENAGFSTAKPWMRINDNYRELNVAAQQQDKDSVLHFWKQAVKMRKQHLALFTYGAFELVDVENPSTFTFVKEDLKTGALALVALNFTADEQSIFVPKKLQGRAKTLLLSNLGAEVQGEKLAAWEGRVYLVE